jgi:protein involved in polysaccharide export with SLBB domain
VLNVEPGVKSIDELPDVQMEDDDKVNIPHVPSTVAVVGFVYNPGSFLFDSRGTAGRYLKLAGNTRPQADMKHAFVLRANGTVVARTSVNGLFSGDQFSSLRLHPGDQVVVPNKLETGAWVRGLRDWTQIASQLALTGAALAVIH